MDSNHADKDALLALLQAHGQDFLSSFGSLSKSTAHQSRKRRKLEHTAASELQGGFNEEDSVTSDHEWTGFDEDSETSSGSEGEGEDSEIDEYDDVHDDDFRSDHFLTKKQPEVVVFSAPSTSELPRTSKSQAKSFMARIPDMFQAYAVEAKDASNGDEEDHDDETTNLQNDKLLHKLVHTQLLSGSLNSELNLTPAQRRKALDGRVLELAARAKLGKGESIVRQEERKKASKRVRMGLERKVEERRGKAMEEAKDLGIYHHSIKHLFEGDADRKRDRRKRDRGLKLGVGKFSRGVLKLSRDDIASVQGDARPMKGGKKIGGKRR